MKAYFRLTAWLKRRVFWGDQRGSALVLVAVLLIGAAFLVASVSAVSILQRKMSTAVSNSAPAFQAADSGIEWSMKYFRDYSSGENTDPSTPIAGIGFDQFMLGTSAGWDGDKLFCPNSIFESNSNSDYQCEIYFLDRDGKFLRPTDLVSEVFYVRSVGTYGRGDEKAVRALQTEVNLMPAPVAWWKLERSEDGPNGPAKDSASPGSSSNATMQGTSWRSGGSHCHDTDASCLQFDGSNDYLEVGGDNLGEMLNQNQVTLTFWVRTSEQGSGPGACFLDNNGQGIIGGYDRSNGIDVWAALGGGRVFSGVRDEGGCSSGSYEIMGNPNGVTTGSPWHFVAISRDKTEDAVNDRNNWRICIDEARGSLSDESNSDCRWGDLSLMEEGAGILDDGELNKIGKVSLFPGDGDAYFKGYLDDIRVYDFIPNQLQLGSLYKKGPE